MKFIPRGIPIGENDNGLWPTRRYDLSKWPTTFDRPRGKRMKQRTKLFRSGNFDKLASLSSDSESESETPEEDLSEATTTSTPSPSRYSWNYSDEQCFPTKENEDSSDGDNLSGSSGCLSNHDDEGLDISRGPAEVKTGASENYAFNNFSFKNLSQLAYINYDLMSKGHKDETQLSADRR